MASPAKCFFAYASNPPATAETLETAIEHMNQYAGGELHVKSWRKLKVTGKLIVDEIIGAIDDCDLFICDLTTANPNVLFELGYAIARNKRVWITLDTSFDEARTNYDKLRLLTTVGYADYHHADQLVTKFFHEMPYNDTSSTIYNSIIQSIAISDRLPIGLLYLKSGTPTEASVRLSSRLEKSDIPLVIDDPQENNSQPLTWYARNVYFASAVIIHLLDEGRGNRLLHNAKYSFVAGIAFGLKKPLLVLAHAPFVSPLDYKDLLQVHQTASQCISLLEAWLPVAKLSYQEERAKLVAQVKEIDHAVTLRRINLGEDQAENERQGLLDYFIDTAPYFQALNAPQSMIYVGRKGTGKTAILYKVATDLQADRRNFVCVIRPASYELEGLVNLLRLSTSKAERGFLVESLWKFLIYTELALSVLSDISSRPLHYVPTQTEQALIEYVDNHSELVKPDFTIRMERAIQELCQVDLSGSSALQRARVSEVLHTQILAGLREALGRVLEKNERVCILIDNLDKAWSRGGNLSLLSDFLFGLLSVSRSVAEEFQKQGPTWRPVNLSLLVFLRSDIFSFVITEARERDKLTYSRLLWNDPDLLHRIIEERFVAASDRALSPEDVWHTYFVETVKGVPTKTYLVTRIIPRPRDLIVWCKAALANAVNHRHLVIDELDVIKAEDEYSQYAFNSLEAETSAQFESIEKVLYEFVGSDTIVTRDQIRELLNRAKVSVDLEQKVVDLLCDATFLGLEISIGKFEFIFDETKKPVLQSMARKVAESSGDERFLINTPFHAFLGIKPDS